jgi:hypothetical protein
MVGADVRAPYDCVDRAEDGQMATKTRRFRELIEANEILVQRCLTAAQREATHGATR